MIYRYYLFFQQKLNGGTTVSGTMVVANLVGIQIFVTGGIGGVHYGVQESEYSYHTIYLMMPVIFIKSNLNILFLC